MPRKKIYKKKQNKQIGKRFRKPQKELGYPYKSNTSRIRIEERYRVIHSKESLSISWESKDQTRFQNDLVYHMVKHNQALMEEKEEKEGKRK